MRPALDDGRRSWHADELRSAVDEAARWLRDSGTRVLATVLDNTPAFVALDEAALLAAVVHVPLPLFFTAAQMQHALQAAGVDTLVAAAPLAARGPGLDWKPLALAGEDLLAVRLPAAPVALPAGPVKIPFTSGTTGSP